jgi:hypothetical protein
MTNTDTTAEWIAARFGYDGQSFEDNDGVSLHTVIAETEGAHYWQCANGDWIVRFSDSSYMVVSVYWDIARFFDGRICTDGGDWCLANKDGEPVNWTYRLNYSR